MSRIGRAERFHGETGAGKDGLLRLFDAQIHGCMGCRGKYGDWRGNESRPEHHQKLKSHLDAQLVALVVLAVKAAADDVLARLVV